MKRFLTLLLSIIIVLSLVACGDKEYILDKLKDEYLINNLEIPKPLRYYSNATGYMMNAKTLK